MPVRLIIFDKDGTLIDNNVLFSPVVESMLKKLSGDEKEMKKIAKYIGYDLKNKKFVPEGFIASQPLRVSAKMISQKFKISEQEIIKSCPPLKINKKTIRPYVDLHSLFQLLRDEGIKIAMNTSDGRKNTEKCIDILGIREYLDMVVCGDDGIPIKPAPDTINHICDTLGVSPRQTYMVGDTQADIDSGIRSKCYRVFLVREDGKFNKFENQHININNVKQLENYL